ncbi:MAG: URC4/urg3 family protein [Symploca sp. SIO3C6]|nr:URC4/urg3 family protein [Symploca sp. SIO3C6]
MVVNNAQQQLITYLKTPKAIRERCNRLFKLAYTDSLPYFYCDLSQLDKVANYVIEVIREQYPDLNIPFHSRWRHFEVGKILRLTELEHKLSGLTPLEIAQTKFDLVIVSVLLDAGAGANWQYQESETGLVFRRSEGLAVASFRMFCQGTFSSDPAYPLQVDAQALKKLTLEQLAQGFQVSQGNQLLGLEGRLLLLQRLGLSISRLPKMFGESHPRPGNLVNYLLDLSTSPPSSVPLSTSGVADWGIQVTEKRQKPSPVKSKLSASRVLTAVLEGLGNIWPGRLAIANVNLGDVWLHPALKVEDDSDHYVPFHKLSQWLTYSLLEPLQELGMEITELEQLTGLPEYRNGGLCLDLGLLKLKDTSILKEPQLPGSVAIVEWRALTVSLLDSIAVVIRQQLKMNSQELPLVKILQGGTWTAGRKLANQLRVGGSPPLQIKSDGTVF